MSKRYPPLKYKTIKKMLKKLGCKESHTLKGSHVVWYNPANEIFFQVVNHGSKEILVSTIHVMLGRAGIDKDTFYNAR